MNFIPSAAGLKLSLTLLKAQKHSPRIMFAAGIAGTVATAVLASRATLKAAPIIEEHQDYIRAFEDHYERNAAYTTQDMRKDKAYRLFKTTKQVVVLYAPAIAAASASIALLTGSHVILTRRNAAVTAAYASLDKAYREYRGRVRDDVGEEKERELYRNVETVKATEVDANGKKKQVTKKVLKDGRGAYSFFYCEYPDGDHRNPNWQETPEWNIVQLRAFQQQFNNQLKSRGVVFLNEVLKDLGLPINKMGQQVGWSHNNPNGDGFIDFGISDDKDAQRIFDFVKGARTEPDGDPGIWLDFNVDGVVLDFI